MSELEKTKHHEVAVKFLDRMLDVFARTSARPMKAAIDPGVLDRWEAASCLCFFWGFGHMLRNT